jgi:hypothetical protein
MNDTLGGSKRTKLNYGLRYSYMTSGRISLFWLRIFSAKMRKPTVFYLKYFPTITNVSNICNLIFQFRYHNGIKSSNRILVIFLESMGARQMLSMEISKMTEF